MEVNKGGKMINEVARRDFSITQSDLDTLTDRFILSQDIKETTKGTYRRSLKRFLEWLTGEGIQNPTRDDILAYKGYLQTQGLSSLTLSTYMVVVRRFFEWTEGMKLYPNIAKGIKGAKRSRGFRKECLTINQVKELLNNIDRSNPQGKRNYAMLNLMVRTGLRTIEIIRADIEDIRQESGEAVLWIQGKGRDSKDEFVLLTEKTLKPIRDFINTRGAVKDLEPLFPSLSDRNKGKRLTTQSISKITKKSLRGIGLNSDRLTAHSLRHTAITLSLKGGATIQEARTLGRHADINTTLIYAHNIDRIEQAPERKIDAILAEAS